MNSLLRTILAPITALLAAFCLAAAAASFVFVTYEANKFLDAQLQEIAINTSKKTPMDFETEDEDRLVVRVWDRSGAIAYRGGPSVDIPWKHQPGLADAVVDGQLSRVYRWSTAHHNAQIAQAWSARREIAAFAATGAALPLLLAVPLAWLLIRWSIGRTLREISIAYHPQSATEASRCANPFSPRTYRPRSCPSLQRLINLSNAIVRHGKPSDVSLPTQPTNFGHRLPRCKYRPTIY